MIHLYMIIVPIFGLLILASLIVLKLTLSQPKVHELKDYSLKQQKHNNKINPQQSIKSKSQKQFGYKRIYLYILKNYTLLQLFLLRRPRNKVWLILEISIVSMLVWITSIDFIFCFVGSLIGIVFSLCKMISTNSLSRQQAKIQIKIQHKVQIIFGLISLITNFFMIWSIMRNYHQQLLSQASISFFITSALDNFIVKPICFAIYTIPLQNINSIIEFINTEEQIVEILNGQRQFTKNLQVKISAISPNKLIFSPSKVPKALIQIQKNKKQQYKQIQVSTLQLYKKQKKQNITPLSHKKQKINRQKNNQEGENSLISLFNTNKKKQKQNPYHRSISYDCSDLFNQNIQNRSPKIQVKQASELQIIQVKKLQQKLEYINGQIDKIISQPNDQIVSQQNYHIGMKKIQTIRYPYDQIIGQQSKDIINQEIDHMIHPDYSIINSFTNDIQNQQQQDYQLAIKQQKSSNKQNNLKQQINFNQFDENTHSQDQNHNQNLNQQNLDYNDQLNGIVQQSNNQYLNIDLNNQYGMCQYLEQINLNSPFKRNPNNLSNPNNNPINPRQNMLQACIQQKGLKKRVKSKKRGPSRPLIKLSTGQPYLQFLPNLLGKSKQLTKKRKNQVISQQAISRKCDIDYKNYRQSRLINSVKRNNKYKQFDKQKIQQISKGNQQNYVPELIVEDFQT